MGDRKARLAALASKAGRSKQVQVEETKNDDGNEENAVGNSSKTITFRNYAPKDVALDQTREHDQKEDEPSNKRIKLSQDGTSVLDQALQEAQQDLATSTPQDRMVPATEKINGDLKRDIESKLKKLERRTQKIIVEMLKERLEQEAAQQASDEDDNGSDLD